jgi:plasmid stabilization system protein ParE
LKVFFTDRAEADLREIALFIARGNPAKDYESVAFFTE